MLQQRLSARTWGEFLSDWTKTKDVNREIARHGNVSTSGYACKFFDWQRRCPIVHLGQHTGWYSDGYNECVNHDGVRFPWVEKWVNRGKPCQKDWNVNVLGHYNHEPQKMRLLQLLVRIARLMRSLIVYFIALKMSFLSAYNIFWANHQLILANVRHSCKRRLTFWMTAKP